MSKLTSVVGVMGAGKTKKLVETFTKMSEKGRRVTVFKHTMDVSRDGERTQAVARDGSSVPATTITSLNEILEHEPNSGFDLILVDEIQFFDDENTIEVIESLLLDDIEVWVFGLDLNSDFESFGIMGEILALSDDVKKIKCKCHVCGKPARVSMFMKGEKKSEVQVGDLDDYMPTCRKCYHMMDSISEEISNPMRRIYLAYPDMELEIFIPDKDLAKAGYSINDVRDINSSVGANNLLRDIGMDEMNYGN